MKNKGFTLTEILAIIVIISIIAIIAAPNITKEINRVDQKNNDVYMQNLENAAHLYVAKYYGPITTTVTIPGQTLVDDGLIGEVRNENCSITVENDGAQYIFSGYNSCK